MDNKYCAHSYGSYSSLNDAISACTADANCGNVFDQNCDNQEPFTLCETNEKIAVSNALSPSCIYERPGW